MFTEHRMRTFITVTMHGTVEVFLFMTVQQLTVVCHVEIYSMYTTICK